MNLPRAVEEAVAETRASIRIGYPWWLRLFLMRDVIAITLGRRVYVSARVAEEKLERLLRHELAHVRQINRLGLLRFYRRYLAEFGRHLWRERSLQRAYARISFEREAVAAEEGVNL
jgi:hypothetical protein